MHVKHLSARRRDVRRQTLGSRQRPDRHRVFLPTLTFVSPSPPCYNDFTSRPQSGNMSWRDSKELQLVDNLDEIQPLIWLVSLAVCMQFSLKAISHFQCLSCESPEDHSLFTIPLPLAGSSTRHSSRDGYHRLGTRCLPVVAFANRHAIVSARSSLFNRTPTYRLSLHSSDLCSVHQTHLEFRCTLGW